MRCSSFWCRYLILLLVVGFVQPLPDLSHFREKRSVHCSEEELFDAVLAHYGEIASRHHKKAKRISPEFGPDCLSNSTKFCDIDMRPEWAEELGYSHDDFMSAKGAHYGLGCGNPIQAANLNYGDVVVDLGSGTGFDAVIAAHKVGAEGRVIGVDMTPEMIRVSRKYAHDENLENLEFHLGQIQDAPVPDGIANVVISNCVFNILYKTQKQKAVNEMYRILMHGGRLVISTLLGVPVGRGMHVPKTNCCFIGVTLEHDLEEMLRHAGFVHVHVKHEGHVDPIVEDGVRIQAAVVFARKP